MILLGHFDDLGFRTDDPIDMYLLDQKLGSEFIIGQALDQFNVDDDLTVIFMGRFNHAF